MNFKNWEEYLMNLEKPRKTTKYMMRRTDPLLGNGSVNEVEGLKRKKKCR
jgi:hypothetical protein